MAASILYDGVVSGAAIVTAIASVSAASLIPIVSANGQQVVIILEDNA